jgi:hypothetical protein
MTDDEIVLDPARAARGGADLFHAGEALSSLRTGPGAEIAAASAGKPWGNDDIGTTFDTNYRPVEQAILGAWESIGSYVEGLGSAVVTSVSSTVDTDTAAGQRLGQV